jgi:predicted PurR-regulated permease PerM
MPASNRPDRNRTPLMEWPAFRVLITCLATLSVLALSYVVWQVVTRFAGLLTLLLFACLLAFVLSPPVAALERHRVPRALAALGIYVVLFGLIGLGLAAAVVPLTGQLTALANHAPQYTNLLNHRLQSLDSFLASHHLPIHIGNLQSQASRVTQLATQNALGNAVNILTTLANTIVDGVLMLVLSIYLLIDGRRIHDNIHRVIPERHRDRAFFIEAAIVRVLGGYIRGQLIMALLIGILAGTGCYFLHVDYPLVIGVLAGFFELIPMVGPALSAVPAVLIAFFQSPGLALWVIVYFIIIQQIESNVLGPRITGHAVGIHPIGSIIALTIGVEVDGLVGALIAVPIAGILYVMAVAIYWEWTGHQMPARRRRSTFEQARALFAQRRVANTEAEATALQAAANTVTTVAGDETPPPSTLAAIREVAATRREEFEQAEQEREQDERDDQHGQGTGVAQEPLGVGSRS